MSEQATQPVASMERVAEVLLRERARHLDEYGADGLAALPTHCQCGGWDPVMCDFADHITARQTDALVAAGVFSEPQPVDREALKVALNHASTREYRLGGALFIEGTENDFADAVLALIGGRHDPQA